MAEHTPGPRAVECAEGELMQTLKQTRHLLNCVIVAEVCRYGSSLCVRLVDQRATIDAVLAKAAPTPATEGN